MTLQHSQRDRRTEAVDQSQSASSISAHSSYTPTSGHTSSQASQDTPNQVSSPNVAPVEVEARIRIGANRIFHPIASTDASTFSRSLYKNTSAFF